MDSARGFTLLFGIFLILISGLLADETKECKKKNPCQCFLSDGKVINLESLANQNTTARFKQEYNDSAVVSYNPCKSFSGEDECKEAAACLQEPGKFSSVNHTSMFGTQNSFKWNSNGTSISYEYKDRTFTVSLVCNDSINGRFEITNISGDTIEAELTSKCACEDGCPIKVDPSPPPPKSSISTGSILLILFFSLVFAYLVGGIIYNKIVNGATGKELIPNVEFWTALPKLVLDGVAFTCNCCTKRKSTPGYDNV